MGKSVLFASVLLALAIQFATPSGADAQTNNPCIGSLTCALSSIVIAQCYPTPQQGAFNCQGIPYEFEQICNVMLLCTPADAAGETHASCPRNNSSQPPITCTVGSPISVADGNTSIEEQDVKLPGLGGGLNLTRTWNSLWPSTQTAYQIGLFGPNWRSNYEERIFVGVDNYIKYARGDGSFWSFGYNGGVWSPAAPKDVIITLYPGPAYWTLIFQNGEQRLFDNTSGNLIAIIDRNGNTTQLSYNAVGLLSTVTDPASRTLSFSYGNQSFPTLVTSVSSSVGITVSYSYDSQGRLIQVTEPDSSTLNFQYNSQSLITSVTDTDGVVLESHTYDSSERGLTSSRANGIEAVSVSYPN